MVILHPLRVSRAAVWKAAATAPSDTPRTGTRVVGSLQDEHGGSGYPVASASLSRSRSGVGGPAGAPNALNELDPLPQACYTSGGDVTGYLRPGDPPPLAPGPETIPEPRPAGGRCVPYGIWLRWRALVLIWPPLQLSVELAKRARRDHLRGGAGSGLREHLTKVGLTISGRSATIWCCDRGRGRAVLAASGCRCASS